MPCWPPDPKFWKPEVASSTYKLCTKAIGSIVAPAIPTRHRLRFKKLCYEVRASLPFQRGGRGYDTVENRYLRPYPRIVAMRRLPLATVASEPLFTLPAKFSRNNLQVTAWGN